MFIRNLPAILAAFFLLSCSDDEQPAPPKEKFSITIDHVTSAKAGEPFTLALSSSQGHVISSASIENKTTLATNVTLESASLIKVSIPVLYEKETFSFTVSATNAEGETASVDGDVDILLNMKPSIDISNAISNRVEIDGQTSFDFEITADDEDGIASYELFAEKESVEITRKSDNVFSVKYNQTEEQGYARLAMAITDNYGQTRVGYYTDSSKNESIDISGDEYAFVGSTMNLWFHHQNPSADIKRLSVEWKQLSGEVVKFIEDTSGGISISVPNKNSDELIVMEARITMSNGTTYVDQHSIRVMENISYSATPIGTDELMELLQQRPRKIIDLNGDGMADEVVMKKGIISLKVSKADGSFTEIENAGKISLHQGTTRGWYEGMLAEDIREFLEYEVKTVEDIDGDGHKDIVFAGGNDLNSTYDIGWIRAINEDSTAFAGDYLFGEDGAGIYSGELIDLNGDNIKEYVSTSAYATYGPNIDWLLPDHTLAASYFCCYGLNLVNPLSLQDYMYLRDINNDGQMELVTLHAKGEYFEPGKDGWLLVQTFNKETKSFDKKKTIHFTGGKMDTLIVADINNDQASDIMVRTMKGQFYIIKLDDN